MPKGVWICYGTTPRCQRQQERRAREHTAWLQGARHLPHQLGMASWGPCSVTTALGNPRPARQSGVLQPFEPKNCGCSPTWLWGQGKWSRNGARSLVMCCWAVPGAVSVMCDGHGTAGGSPGNDGHAGLQPHVAKFVGFPPDLWADTETAALPPAPWGDTELGKLRVPGAVWGGCLKPRAVGMFRCRAMVWWRTVGVRTEVGLDDFGVSSNLEIRCDSVRRSAAPLPQPKPVSNWDGPSGCAGCVTTHFGPPAPTLAIKTGPGEAVSP